MSYTIFVDTQHENEVGYVNQSPIKLVAALAINALLVMWCELA